MSDKDVLAAGPQLPKVLNPTGWTTNLSSRSSYLRCFWTRLLRLLLPPWLMQSRYTKMLGCPQPWRPRPKACQISTDKSLNRQAFYYSLGSDPVPSDFVKSNCLKYSGERAFHIIFLLENTVSPSYNHYDKLDFTLCLGYFAKSLSVHSHQTCTTVFSSVQNLQLLNWF